MWENMPGSRASDKNTWKSLGLIKHLLRPQTAQDQRARDRSAAAHDSAPSW